MRHAEEFAEFAAAASPRLLRAAYLLCGNPHTAEDLAQTTLKAQADAVRATVIDGLTEAEYRTTMRALQQMTTNLEQAAPARCVG
jgi:hypothetical protein